MFYFKNNRIDGLIKNLYYSDCAALVIRIFP